MSWSHSNMIICIYASTSTGFSCQRKDGNCPCYRNDSAVVLDGFNRLTWND